MEKTYKGPERRKFLRLDYTTPLAYKICKRKTISSLLEGYVSDISRLGLRSKIRQKVKKNDILWLSFDRPTLNICEDLEKKALIYQKGVIGKVVWIKPKGKKIYEVGVQFITRQEKNLTHIYPQINFLKQNSAPIIDEDSEEEIEIAEPEPLQEEEREEE